MDPLEEIIVRIELHDVEGIRRCFEQGLSPNNYYKGEPLIYELTSEYTRSPRFKNCVEVFVDHGLEFEDKPLLTILLDDAQALEKLLSEDTRIADHKYTLKCAYTPLHKVTLLHVCAEFNHVECAKVLLKYGADINALAGIDDHGFGGQTPIFHTVNQNNNQSADMMDFLLAHSANLSITVDGLIWGKGYEWETLMPAVNPISYAMMGLLPQMHRNETTTHQIITKLLNHAFGIIYEPKNVPNKYLNE